MKRFQNTHLLMIHFMISKPMLKWIFIDLFYLEVELIMLIHFEIFKNNILLSDSRLSIIRSVISICCESNIEI